MADDRTKRGPQDRQRISLSDDYEVRYWSQKWGVSKEELADAVRKAGPMADSVAKQLGKEP
jgi:hypothetical protein